MFIDPMAERDTSPCTGGCWKVESRENGAVEEPLEKGLGGPEGPSPAGRPTRLEERCDGCGVC